MTGKQKPELPQGTLDMLVLKALSLGPMHGYGVGQRIGQLWRETLRYHKNRAYLYEVRQVREATEWLLVNSDDL